MRHTHQQPFRFHLRQPAQQKLPKAAHMFDLREDRFDDHFSSAEHCTSSFAPKLVPHPFLQRSVAGQRGLRRSREWLTLIWWHMQIDSPYGLMRDRKSTRLNSSHPSISYAVFCLKKKTN